MNQLGKVKSRRLVVIKYQYCEAIAKEGHQRDNPPSNPKPRYHDVLTAEFYLRGFLAVAFTHTHSSPGCLVLFASVAQRASLPRFIL